MADKNYPSLAAFVRDFPRFSKKLTTGLVVEYHKQNHAWGKRALIRAISGVSSGNLSSSIKTGDSTIGSGRFLKLAGLSGSVGRRPETMTSPGMTTVISLHKGFHAVDFGRRPSKPYRYGRQKGMVRLLGASGAPRGFTTPVAQRQISNSVQAALRAKAFRIAWKKAR